MSKNLTMTPDRFTRLHGEANNLVLDKIDGVWVIAGVDFNLSLAGSGVATRELLDVLLGADFMTECDRIAFELYKMDEGDE